MQFYRVEKDNTNIKHEIEELKVISDEVLRAKVHVFLISIVIFYVIEWIALMCR